MVNLNLISVSILWATLHGSLANVMNGMMTKKVRYLFISQQAMIEGMRKKYNYSHCTVAHSPYRSGLKIHRTDHNGVNPSQVKKIMKEYQYLAAGLNWLSISTLLDISTLYSLLSQFNSNPSQRHHEAAKYFIQYLKHTSLQRIWYKQGGK